MIFEKSEINEICLQPFLCGLKVYTKINTIFAAL